MEFLYRDFRINNLKTRTHVVVILEAASFLLYSHIIFLVVLTRTVFCYILLCLYRQYTYLHVLIFFYIYRQYFENSRVETAFIGYSSEMTALTVRQATDDTAEDRDDDDYWDFTVCS